MKGMQDVEVFAGFGETLVEVSFALMPLIFFFAIFQIFFLKYPVNKLMNMIKGIILAFFGLAFFLQGVHIGFFPVGEVNGSHGVYRPGGAALNSGQVGSTRAAQYISAQYNDLPEKKNSFLDKTRKQIKEKIELGNKFLKDDGSKDVEEIRKEIGQRMSEYGAHIRSLKDVKKAAEKTRQQLNSLGENTKLNSISNLNRAFKNYDLLISQYIYLSAIENYIERGGKSRGSYLVKDPEGKLPLSNLPEKFRFSLSQENFTDKIQQVIFNKDINCEFEWRPVTPLPEADSWFEKVWNKFRNNEIIR